MSELFDSAPAAGRADDRGRVTLICGCMFSGKTTELLRRVHAAGDEAAIVFKHSYDDRYSAREIATHDGRRWPAVTVRCADDIRPRAGAARLVAIDEAHFFDAELPRVVRLLADGGSAVVLTTLDRDSWARPFPIVAALRRVADETLTRFGRCVVCGAPADRTQRLTPIIDGNLIGGPEAFDARCGKCWRPPPEPAPAHFHPREPQ